MTTAPGLERTSARVETAEERLRAYVGWLVRTWREASDDAELRVQRRLSERLQEIDPDVRIDPSRLSRLETGRTPPQLAWLALVEEAVGVPTNLLVATVDGLYRDHEVVLPAPRPAESATWMHRVHEALETIASAPVTGAAWYELARLLEGSGRLAYLPPDQRRLLAETLVAEVPRSVGLARVQRVQAMRALLTTRVLGQDLRRVVAAHLDEPHSRGASDLVARLHEDGGAHSRRLLARLGRHARPEVRAAVARLDDRHRSVGSPARPGQAPAVRPEVTAALVHTGRPDDLTLARLLPDVLGSRGPAYAAEARTVLAASPLRAVLARHAAERAASGSWFGAAWLRLLGELGTRREIAAVVALAARPSPTVHDPALGALARLPGEDGEVARTWDGTAGAGPTVSAALLHALGMTGHPRLADLAADAGQSDDVRGTATWWLRAGGAIHEEV